MEEQISNIVVCEQFNQRLNSSIIPEFDQGADGLTSNSRLAIF
jgi:hypothetical protein